MAVACKFSRIVLKKYLLNYPGYQFKEKTP